jgi:hypothetical protein
MSNELRTSVSVACTNGNYADSFSVNSSYNQTSQGASAGTLTTSTSAASLPVGSLSTVGWLCCRNLDGTNNIFVGGYASSTYVPFAELLPGEWGVFRIDPSATIKVKSSAGTPILQYMWLNN